MLRRSSCFLLVVTLSFVASFTSHSKTNDSILDPYLNCTQYQISSAKRKECVEIRQLALEIVTGYISSEKPVEIESEDDDLFNKYRKIAFFYMGENTKPQVDTLILKPLYSYTDDKEEHLPVTSGYSIEADETIEDITFYCENQMLCFDQDEASNDKDELELERFDTDSFWSVDKNGVDSHLHLIPLAKGIFIQVLIEEPYDKDDLYYLGTIIAPSKWYFEQLNEKYKKMKLGPEDQTHISSLLNRQGELIERINMLSIKSEIVTQELLKESILEFEKNQQAYNSLVKSL